MLNYKKKKILLAQYQHVNIVLWHCKHADVCIQLKAPLSLRTASQSWQHGCRLFVLFLVFWGNQVEPQFWEKYIVPIKSIHHPLKSSLFFMVDLIWLYWLIFDLVVAGIGIGLYWDVISSPLLLYKCWWSKQKQNQKTPDRICCWLI